MVVYRLEHSNGIGPYQYDQHLELIAGSWAKIAKYHEYLDLLADMGRTHKRETHPSPEHDGINCDDFRRDQHFCGCKSLDDLQEWFGGFLPKLLNFGFKINRYEVAKNKVAEGKHQVVFDKIAAKKLAEQK